MNSRSIHYYNRNGYGYVEYRQQWSEEMEETGIIPVWFLCYGKKRVKTGYVFYSSIGAEADWI